MALGIDNDSFSGKSNEDSDVWDGVVDCFNRVDSHHSNTSPGKDNYETVWPVLQQVIYSQSGWSDGVCYRACDFGCGVGNFAEQLSRMKFHTFACDFSKEMIAQARSSSQGGVLYEIGSLDFVRKYSPYKLIISVMVFQFISDLRSAINILKECLDENGLLFFAIHHIEYVHECAKYGVKFRGLENEKNSTVGEILIRDRWIETYIRSPEWYDNLLSAEGLVRVGYSLSANSPPPGISEHERGKWCSSKYYMAWYKYHR